MASFACFSFPFRSYFFANATTPKISQLRETQGLISQIPQNSQNRET